ncbi:hypothetical protein [Streptacidiphilus sp. PAMC 29251]
MITLAAQHGGNPPSSGWFLLLWSLLALPAGIALASRAGSGWFHQRLVQRFQGNHYPRTVPAPVWGIRTGGVVFALASILGLPFGIWLIAR